MIESPVLVQSMEQAGLRDTKEDTIQRVRTKESASGHETSTSGVKPDDVVVEIHGHENGSGIRETDYKKRQVCTVEQVLVPD